MRSEHETERTDLQRTVEMIIKPFESFGPVRFGFTEEMVQAALGLPSVRAPARDSTGASVVYDRVGLRIDFDTSGLCDSVESVAPCVPLLDELRLTGRVDDIVAVLTAQGHAFRQGDSPHDDWTLYCDDLGLVIWRDNIACEAPGSISAVRNGHSCLRGSK